MGNSHTERDRDRLDMQPIDSAPIAPEPADMTLDFASQTPLPPLEQVDLPSLDSSAPTNQSTAESDDAAESWRIETSRGPIWLEGDSILCACPDCGAPMSVRLWLLLAECWQCSTDIELTEEQQRAVEELLARKAAQQRPAEGSPAQKTDARWRETPAAAQATDRPQSRSRPQSQRAGWERRINPAQSPTPSLSPEQVAIRRIKHGLKMTPAWLISLVLHFILLLLLALLAITDYGEFDSITLSQFISPVDREGGMVEVDEGVDELQFDLPLPAEFDVDDEQEFEELQQATEDAREIREDESPTVELPDYNQLKQQLVADVDRRSHFVARDPRVRIEMVKREGGTTMTEAAVARGLAWLARHQNFDGSWSLEDYENSHRRGNEGDAAATSLALLPFLGAGQTHEFGRYKETVSKGLIWLLSNQESNGDLRAGMTNNYGMYAHGQASIVLVEALALSGDERFRGPAQRAINFIVEAQHDEGGWRYRPGQAGDTSVFGWQMMALQSARSPGVGLEVPDTTMQLAEYYLDLTASNDGALYAYQPDERRNPTPTMTAEALLCRMYLGWRRDDPRLQKGMKWLMDKGLASTGRKNLYYWYYATQAFHNFGGRMWDEWNLDMRELLTGLQTTRGRHAGSWRPSGFTYGDSGGRVYVTSLAICTLEVYYRHLPIFRRLELD